MVMVADPNKVDKRIKLTPQLTELGSAVWRHFAALDDVQKPGEHHVLQLLSIQA